MSSNDPLLSALTSLLPIHTPSTLPKPLVSLATALLAQSRSAASSLKPDEEAARSTVIADIAVERLKTRLNLQKAPPRPPCGPRIYKKLYQYLDNTLSSFADTASAKNTPTATPTKQRTRDVFSTPTKLGGNGTPTKATANTPSRPLTGGLDFAIIGKQPVLAKNVGATVNDEGVPGWISTTIRHICKKLDISAAIPHIYVGVATLHRESISTSSTATSPTKTQARTPKTGRGLLDAAVSSRVSAETENTVKIPGLIIAVMLLVIKRMYPSNDKVNVRTVSHELVALGRVTSKRLREVMMECERLEEDEREMDRWQGMEWFDNVPLGEEGGNDDGDVEMVDVRDELDHGNGDRIVVKRTVASNPMPVTAPPDPARTAQAPPAASAPPAATAPATNTRAPASIPAEPPTQNPSQPLPQAQPPQRIPRPRSSTARNADDVRLTGLGAIDWLSPARRADYKKWEASILQRLSIMEGSQSGAVARTTPARAGRKRKAEVLSSPVV